MVLYVYLGLLQVVAVVLAVQTRKVKIKGLNETKEVAAIIYVSSIILIGLAIVSITLRQYQNIGEALLNTGLIAANTTFIAVLFAPKVCCVCLCVCMRVRVCVCVCVCVRVHVCV